MRVSMKLICVLAVAAFAASALAEDLQPPRWRGRISTTSQVWEFNQEIDPCSEIPPDGPAPGGQPPLPSTELSWDPSISGDPPQPPWDHWMPDDRPIEYEPGKWAGIGVVPLSGSLYIVVTLGLDPRRSKQSTPLPQQSTGLLLLQGLPPKEKVACCTSLPFLPDRIRLILYLCFYYCKF